MTASQPACAGYVGDYPFRRGPGTPDWLERQRDGIGLQNRWSCLVNAGHLNYTPAMRHLLSLALYLASLPAIAQTATPASSQSTPPTAAQAAPSADEIVAQEQLLWKAYSSGDAEALDGLMLPDFTSVSKTISNRDEVLSAMKQLHRSCSIGPVSMNRPEVTILSPDVATIAYSAAISTICDNRTTKATTNATTVWVRHSGRWQMHLHTEFMVSGFAVQSQ